MPRARLVQGTFSASSSSSLPSPSSSGRLFSFSNTSRMASISISVRVRVCVRACVQSTSSGPCTYPRTCAAAQRSNVHSQSHICARLDLRLQRSVRAQRLHSGRGLSEGAFGSWPHHFMHRCQKKSKWCQRMPGAYYQIICLCFLKVA